MNNIKIFCPLKMFACNPICATLVDSHGHVETVNYLATLFPGQA